MLGGLLVGESAGSFAMMRSSPTNRRRRRKFYKDGNFTEDWSQDETTATRIGELWGTLGTGQTERGTNGDKFTTNPRGESSWMKGTKCQSGSGPISPFIRGGHAGRVASGRVRGDFRNDEIFANEEFREQRLKECTRKRQRWSSGRNSCRNRSRIWPRYYILRDSRAKIQGNEVQLRWRTAQDVGQLLLGGRLVSRSDGRDQGESKKTQRAVL